MVWKINKGVKVPGFILAEQSKGIGLRRVCLEWGYPDDFVTLEILKDYTQIALITAIDGASKTSSNPFLKFFCYSLSDKKQIITTYQTYFYKGPVIVKAWKDEKKSLLENIDMFNIDIAPDRVPNKVIQKHLERIAEEQCVTKNLRDRAEKTFFDILWNVQSY